MKRYLLAAMVFSLLVGMLPGPVLSQSSDTMDRQGASGPAGDSVLFDVLFLRPVGIVACAVGLAGSVVATPFVITSESPSRVYKALVVDPFAYTFKRRVGDTGSKNGGSSMSSPGY
jgi:hypothetical protein